MRKICIATGTRADWGLLSGIAKALDSRDDVELQIVATNMHLSERYGATYHEIERDGLHIDYRVPMPADTDSPHDTVVAMSECMRGFADAYETLRPDLLIILGDRYEMLAVASAAAMMRIPIIHIAGGTVSEGAVDDSIRHAITKLASLHLAETDEARRRIVQMGEDPARVVATGALGVWNIMNQPLLSKAELEESLGGFTLDPESTLLVTYHPATLDNGDPAARFNELLGALDMFPRSKVLLTHPNNDAGGEAIAALVEDYARANPDRVRAVTSLGMLRYLSSLRNVAAVVGKSSSGIVEVPSMHIPTVDVGIRQKGRLCSASVIHCADDCESITEAIATALSSEGRRQAREASNPYYRPDTVTLMVRTILDFMPRRNVTKRFNNLK